MRLLVSAYACRPDIGSEPAVGWNWVLELSKHHDLWVLTNFTNQMHIDNYLTQNPGLSNRVKFIYVRPSRILTFWYREWARFERLYYFFWQRRAYLTAKELNKEVKFDCVQHLTYVTCILPTYMHRLGIPFVFGPVSGGEKIPRAIRYPLDFKSYLCESARRCTQLIPVLSFNMRRAFKKARIIFSVTEETLTLIPKKYHHKVKIIQAIGITENCCRPKPRYASHPECPFLIVGRMIYWKGFEAGIKAAVKALDQGRKFELTVLGSGNERYTEKLRTLAGKYCENKIKFVKSIEYGKMKYFYEDFDVLLNCSLRDSGCFIVMEAMSRGLPVIWIDTGGPKVNTTSACAIKIAPSEFNRLVDMLCDAITLMSDDAGIRQSMSKSAYEHAVNNFCYASKITALLDYY